MHDHLTTSSHMIPNSDGSKSIFQNNNCENDTETEISTYRYRGE